MPKFMFRGMEMGQIEKLSLEEFSKLIPARERRALKRGFTHDQKKLLEGIRKNPKGFHRTKARGMVIIPEMVGLRIGIHNGREYEAIDIKPEMLGHRLGEFALTRRQVKHSAPGFGATKGSRFVPLK